MIEVVIILKIVVAIFFQILILRSFYIHIRKEEPDKYFALSEFIGKTNLDIYVIYFKYLIFRIFPIFIFCLLNYRILPSLIDVNSNQVFLFNTSLVLIELLFTNLKAYGKYKGMGLSYLHLTFAILVFASSFLSKIFFLYFPAFLPTTQGVIDNVWSAIIIYGVICLLGFFSKDPVEHGNSNLRIFGKERLLLKINDYVDFIEQECERFNADKSLVKAVAIYESIQRPKIFRFMEKILVFLTKMPVSQGIMQIKASKIINDKESITLAIANYFKDTKTLVMPDYYQIEPILNKYNFSERFKKDVSAIYDTIYENFPDSFEVPNPYNIPVHDQGNQNNCTSHAFALMMEYHLSDYFKERTLIDVDDLWEKQKKYGTATEEGDIGDGVFIIATKYGARFKTDSGKSGTMFLTGEKEQQGIITAFKGWRIELD